MRIRKQETLAACNEEYGKNPGKTENERWGN